MQDALSKVNYVILPSNITRAVKSAGGSLRSLLDKDALLSILSKYDVQFYNHCQVWFPIMAKGVFRDLTLSLKGSDTRSFGGEFNNDIYNETMGIKIGDGTGIRFLYDGIMNTDIELNKFEDYCFESVDIGGTIGISLKPFTDADTRVNQMRVSVDRLIGLIRTYETLESIARTTIFGAYTKLCYESMR